MACAGIPTYNMYIIYFVYYLLRIMYELMIIIIVCIISATAADNRSRETAAFSARASKITLLACTARASVTCRRRRQPPRPAHSTTCI